MKRRAYIAVTALALGGCMGSTQDPAGNETDDDAADTESTDEGTDDSSDEYDDDENKDEPDTDEHDDSEDEDEDEDEQQVGDDATFDDFEDFSHWTVLEGSLEATTDEPFIGSQSARLEITESESRVLLAREFEEPQDFADVVPGIAVDAPEMVIPHIWLLDSSGDWIDYRRVVTGDAPFWRYNFGIDHIEGSPDLSDVTELRINTWVGDERAVTFDVDDLFMAPKPDVGKVMIQFDDAHNTDYTEALPVLEEYGYVATSFVNTDRIDREDHWLTREQLEALDDAGWLIGSHSASHPRMSTLDRDEQEAEIREAKQWLEDHGFEDGARYYTYPFGDFDETTLELVEEYHDLAFAGGAPAQGRPANPLLCSRAGEPSVERAHEILDLTAEYRGFSGLFYHRLEGDDLERFEATVAYLHELESAGEIEVILPSDLEAYLL